MSRELKPFLHSKSSEGTGNEREAMKRDVHGVVQPKYIRPYGREQIMDKVSRSMMSTKRRL